MLGDGMDYLVALIVPAEGADEKAIKREIDAVNRTTAPYEAVKRFALVTEGFTQENGMLTPTLKVRRKAVRGAVSRHDRGTCAIGEAGVVPTLPNGTRNEVESGSRRRRCATRSGGSRPTVGRGIASGEATDGSSTRRSRGSSR